MSRPHPSEMCFDGKPTLPHGGDQAACAAYAAVLDRDVPDWFEADETAMYPELAVEALRRRDAR